MIRINIYPAPSMFYGRVIKLGLSWARTHQWDWRAIPPNSSDVPSYWRSVLDDLHDAHKGVCCYLSVYTHRSLQVTSVDHYLPVSKNPLRLAFHWTNYRLSSRAMNTNKGKFLDVIDPQSMPNNLYNINLLTGEININQSVAPPNGILFNAANASLKRLKLNDSIYKDLRIEYINEYLKDCLMINAPQSQVIRDKLKEKSPFIYQEVVRQNW